jgi:hypothetical protein
LLVCLCLLDKRTTLFLANVRIADISLNILHCFSKHIFLLSLIFFVRLRFEHRVLCWQHRHSPTWATPTASISLVILEMEFLELLTKVVLEPQSSWSQPVNYLGLQVWAIGAQLKIILYSLFVMFSCTYEHSIFIWEKGCNASSGVLLFIKMIFYVTFLKLNPLLDFSLCDNYVLHCLRISGPLRNIIYS